MSIHSQLIGYVISSRTTSVCSPAASVASASCHAATARPRDSSRSGESHVNPSPPFSQSTPSCRPTCSSPTFHFPDLMNWTTHPRQQALERQVLGDTVCQFVERCIERRRCSSEQGTDDRLVLERTVKAETE